MSSAVQRSAVQGGSAFPLHGKWCCLCSALAVLERAPVRPSLCERGLGRAPKYLSAGDVDLSRPYAPLQISLASDARCGFPITQGRPGRIRL